MTLDQLHQSVRDLETRVAELEARVTQRCERCQRDLCPTCQAEPTCPHADEGAHEVRP